MVKVVRYFNGLVVSTINTTLVGAMNALKYENFDDCDMVEVKDNKGVIAWNSLLLQTL